MSAEGTVPVVSTGSPDGVSQGTVPVASTGSTDGVSQGTVPVASTGSTDAVSAGTVPVVSTGSTDGVTDGVGAASVRVAAYLRDLILHDVLQPGDRIRQEEIAERFGASRLPVREALRMLEAEGLTEHEPNKGARVPRLSMHEVDVVYRMRERLEPLALAESLPRLTAADHAHLEDVQRQIEENNDLDRFLDLDRAFHLGTYSGCHIEPLNAIVTRLWNSTQHYRRAYVALGGQARMWVVNSEHRLILDAVVRRDSTDAERFLEGHIRRTRIELGHHPGVFGEHP